jgi:Sec7-like guanine-nucleotide exchange factor
MQVKKKKFPGIFFINVFLTDAVYLLSFATIMLATDLHSRSIPQHKKMKREQW